MNKFLFVIGLLMTVSASGQFIVRGIVYDNASHPIPGVTVVNSTDSAIVADSVGRFTLNCPYLYQEISISSVGFKTQKILADTTKLIEIVLQPDSVILNVTPLLCYFYNRHSKIGFASGIYFTPIGFRLENFTPDVFGFWLMLTTGIEWRTNNSHNNYINVFFRKYEIVKLQQTTYLSLYGEFKN